MPVWVQYGRWMGGILLHGTLGEPLLGRRCFDRRRMILDRLPVTIELGVMAIVTRVLDSAASRHLLGDSPGYRRRLRGALHRHHRHGNAQLLAGTYGHGLPGNLVGLVATDASWVPFTEDPLGNLGVFLIPSLILGTAGAAATMRMTRTMMLEVLRQDYIRTAWSKGLNERVVIMRHALKNASHPGSYPDRPAVAYPGRRLRYHGEHLQPAGARVN